MKVHELIAKLQTMPQDMEVFAYSATDEADTYIDAVKICHLDKAWNGYDMEEYYCRAASYAAMYLEDNKHEHEVVVIGNFAI